MKSANAQNSIGENATPPATHGQKVAPPTVQTKKAAASSTWLYAIVLTLLLSVWLSACASPAADSSVDKSASDADVSDTATASAFPMTLENYNIPEQGGAWEPYPVTFAQPPQRIVANTQAAAEFLIKLGVGERVVGVGALYGQPGTDVQAEFEAIPVLNQAYLTEEQVLGANPDLVFGRGDLFNESEYGVGSVAELEQMGIKTYLMHSSRDGCTLDDLYRDIDETGALFEVPDAAQDFADDLKSRIQIIAERYKEAPEKSYCILVPGAQGTYSIFAGPRMSLQEQLLADLNLRSVVGDMMMTVSNEQLVDLNPDIILILVYTGSDPDAVITELRSQQALETVTAIQDDALIPLDFGKATYSFRIVDEIERIAPLIHPDV